MFFAQISPVLHETSLHNIWHLPSGKVPHIFPRHYIDNPFLMPNHLLNFFLNFFGYSYILSMAMLSSHRQYFFRKFEHDSFVIINLVLLFVCFQGKQ